MALLSGLLGGSANNGFLTRMGLLGTPTADPLAASLDPIYYSAGDDRASRISQALHAASAAFTNPPKGRGDLGVLANLANSIGPAYKENNYLNEAIGRQTKSNMLFEEQRKKQLGEEEDLQWADIIAQHPELANMGRAEARKVLADMFEQKQGISRSGSGGPIYATPKYENVPNPDPKTNKQYPNVWQLREFSKDKPGGIVTTLPPGVEPSQYDAEVQGNIAGARRNAVKAVDLNFEKPKVWARTNAAVGNYDNVLHAMDELAKNATGLDLITSKKGLLTDSSVIRTFAPEAARARAQWDKIKSTYVVAALTAMKQASEAGGAFGPVSNYEDQLISAQTALDLAQSPQDVRIALGELMQVVARMKQATVDAYQEAYGPNSFVGTPLPPVSPVIQDAINKGAAEGGGGGGEKPSTMDEWLKSLNQPTGH